MPIASYSTVQHENAAACDLIIKLFCFVFICKPAGQRRSPWSPTGRRRPGCFTSSVDVTWSSVETRTLETLVSAHSPPLMKFLMKNGRSWQLFWFHKQNVNIFLIIVSDISDVHYVFVSFFLFISENLFKYIFKSQRSFFHSSKTWELWIKCLVLRKGAEPCQIARWWWPYHAKWHPEGS